MGQAAIASTVPNAICSKTCRQCSDWDKDLNTVKVDLMSLQDPVMNMAMSPSNSPCKPKPPSEDKPHLILKQEQHWQLHNGSLQREREDELWRRESAQELQRRQDMLKKLADECQAREEKRVKDELARKGFMEETHLRNQRHRDDFERKRKLHSFLENNGFKDVRQIVRKRFHKVCPLHVAVKNKDVEAIRILLWAGADRHAVDSSGETPMQLGERLNSEGSHAAVLAALAEVKISFSEPAPAA